MDASSAPDDCQKTLASAPPAATPVDETAQDDRVLRVSSQTLFHGGAKELEIEHRGALYRLRQTALGKLILTK